MYEFPETRILLFAKEPVYGLVKTRLNDAIGAEQAFQLYCAMLRYQVKKLRDANLAPWEVWVSGDPSNPLLTEMQLTVPLRRQQGADLGERMQGAAEAALAESDSVLLVGTDWPSVSVDYLREASRLLRAGTQVVIGPAEDGGYVLLGLKSCVRELFVGMPWGTDRVLRLTLERLQLLDLPCTTLPARWDVDRAEDLARLVELEPPLDFQLEGS